MPQPSTARAIVLLSCAAFASAATISICDPICRPVADNSRNVNSFATQLIAVLRIRWARIILVTVFIESMATFGSLAVIPAHLYKRFGISLTAAL